MCILYILYTTYLHSYSIYHILYIYYTTLILHYVGVGNRNFRSPDRDMGDGAKEKLDEEDAAVA